MNLSIKKIHAVWAVVLLLLFIFCSPAHAEQDLTARQILDKVDDLYRGASSNGKMTMKIITKHWTRTLSMEFWSKGKEMSLVRILSPKKEKGTATLRSGNEIWNYLPKVKRVIKLPSSMMSASWMGSHFTNDDLVKESRMADDYTFTITFEGQRDGQDVVELTCIPLPDAAIVWGKVLTVVRKKDYQPISITYFDEDMALVRTMTFSEITLINDRTVPMVMTVVPEDNPNEKTTVRYNEITFNVELEDKFFSMRNLQR